MALNIGSVTADEGMSKAIYSQIDTLLAPPLINAVEQAEGLAKAEAQKALDGAREGWQKLAFAIASGVVEHLIANLEVVGIRAQGSVTVGVQGSTGPAAPANHLHAVSLSGTANNVVFTQNNDGTGHVR